METLKQLERQVFELRRRLAIEPEPLPQGSFQALEFRAGSASYAIPIHSVREVLQMLWTDPALDAPEWLLGTFRVGPELVPLIDLEHRLEGRACDRSPAMSIVLVEAPEAIGLAVQEVSGLIDVEPSSLVPVSHGIAQAPFLLGSILTTDGRTIGLLCGRRLGREYILDEDGHAANDGHF